MFGECGHPAEGGLKGREPIEGLFRQIVDYLHGICDPLPLCWELSHQRAGCAQSVKYTHIDFDQSYSQVRQRSSTVVSETSICFGERSQVWLGEG